LKEKIKKNASLRRQKKNARKVEMKDGQKKRRAKRAREKTV